MSNLEQEVHGPNAPPGHSMIRTLTQVVPDAQFVEIVMAPQQDVPGLASDAWSAPGLDDARSRIRDGVLAELRSQSTPRSFTRIIEGNRWRALVEPIRTDGGQLVGALFVARQGRVWAKWERALLKTFGGVVSQEVALMVREQSLLLQRRLDELLGHVAERLMSASVQNQHEILAWTMQALSQSLDVHAATLRRHDYSRDVSVVEAAWSASPTSDVPIEVPLGAYRVVAGRKDLGQPVVTDSGAQLEAQGATSKDANHTQPQSLATVCIPLLGATSTWGALSMAYFPPRNWAAEELRMLQAVATLLMQLQARLDAEGQTTFNAMHDELTGLPNRRALLAELSSRLARRHRTTILFFDLDRFKVMNDFLGHASGDRILSTVAGRIRSTIGPDDFAARLGGDEFVVLLSGVHNDKDALEVADLILAELRQPIDFSGQQITHAASIGIVLSSPGTNNGLELIGWADIALYAAKRRGGNQAVLFDQDLRESVGKRSRTELRLRQAIEGDGLCLYYQPEVDLRTGELLAVEALVRWQHPELGLLPASAFMAVAEEAGLVVDMGHWVFTEACRQLAVWQSEYPDLAVDVRVNVSPSQFMIGDFVKVVDYCLRSFRIPGERLCIEIAERAILQEPEQTARIVHGVRALGIAVAIDDFGTNYASFAELKRLPVNYLKLCPDFVQGIGIDVVDRAIVGTITKLAAALDLGVIAKGIENYETIDKLLDLSCVRGQGSYISAPIAADDVASILRTGVVHLGSDDRATSRRPRDAGSPHHPVTRDMTTRVSAT